MAGDNLTVTIGADSSKLRGEIKLAQAQVRDFDRQLRAALKAGDQTAATGFASQIGRLQSNLASMNRTLAQTGETATTAARSVELSARSFRTLNGALLGIGRTAGGLQGGLLGIAAGFAAAGIQKAITGTVEDLNKLNQTAANISLPAADIRAFQDIMAKAGVSTDAATGALTSFSKAAFNAQLKAGAFNKAQTFGVDIGRGGQESISTLSVNIGEKVTDISDGFALLRINVAKFATTPTGLKQLEIATAKALQNTKLLNAQLRSQIGQQIFGPDWEAITAGLVKYANSPEWALAQQQAEQLFSPEAKARLEEYNAAWAALQKSLRDGVQELTLKYFPELNAAIKAAPGAINELFAEINKTIQTTKKEIQGLIDAWNFMKQAFQSATIEPFGGEWTGEMTRAATAVKEVDATLKDVDATLADVTVTARKASDALVMVGRGLGTGDTGGHGPGSMATQSLVPGTSDYQAPPPKGLFVVPYAEGGMVHGPGTPTSDSVTAQLSAGEFVMRAAAVRQWGPSFMAALNGMGGRMPSRGLPAFAGGGLVSASGGGTPVHLHLGGHSFALSGNESVVGSLVVEAHRHKIRSAGVKPSWYGGTPGR